LTQNLIAEALRKDQIETRARQRLGLPLDLATEDGFDDVEERLSPRLALRAQFDALPPGERDALALRIVDELTYDEVADKLSIRPAAARLRVSRALRRLGATVPQEEI
jgi:RNA polymerase sigma-70 factor (ECF subfamily)